MKRFFSLFLVVQLFLCIKVNASSLFSTKEMEMNFEKTIMASEVDTKFKKENGDYLDYYGGVYVSKDSKNIVVQIVKEKLPARITEEFKKYRSIINSDLAIIVNYVDFSYNELLNLNEEISKTITEEDDNVIGNGIIVSKNSIELDILNRSNENIMTKKLSKIAKNNDILNHIILTETDNIKYNDAPATIKSGEKIIVENNGECSMGFRTKYNGKKGFVTAGHCVEKGKTYYAGKVTKVQFKNKEKYDYAFIETKQSIEPLNDLFFTAGKHFKLAVANFSPIYVENTYVASSGHKSGVTYGKVIKLNCTVDGELSDGSRVITKGMIKADYKTKRGASGAPVFWAEVKNGESVPIGINSSGVYPAGSDITKYSTYSYFTGINDLPNEMKMGRY